MLDCGGKKMALLTGKDVWEVAIKMGWAHGAYYPSSNGTAARAAELAALLNEVLRKRQNWLSELLESEDQMRAWEVRTPREKVLRLYKFLNQLGYTVIGIDAAIERERKNNRSRDPSADLIKQTRP
jgi:hypothetical protein